MGSRAARARKNIAPAPKASVAKISAPASSTPPGMWPIPDLTRGDMVFGNIAHLPPMDQIPARFRVMSRDPYCEFISAWFFRGRTPKDMARLTARHGVERNKALVAIKAILGSFEPKHEHKEAGCAYLLHEWFKLDDSKAGDPS